MDSEQANVSAELLCDLVQLKVLNVVDLVPITL
jgi:hypothetical protein